MAEIAKDSQLLLVSKHIFFLCLYWIFLLDRLIFDQSGS